ncbi:MAG TPA: NAD(P) transhydrogenase subunit alpha [Actinocrinis sp.]|nr:NAD(P) transhydrogenase subunit alpha [Actinocrinis sp.]
MRIGVLSEIKPGERRVALPPEAVSALCAADDTTVTVQSGAGRHLFASDDDYRAAGAEIADSAEQLAAGVDVLAVVNPPEPSVIAALPPGASLLGLLNPFQEAQAMLALRDQGVTAYALELIPRISRAQSVDALSSQALVSGYRAALVGAELLPRFFPLFMTAAGTIPPARVLVLGAGVAGLQAIATARRLGAVVSGYDVRAAAADEVRSLGATFVDLKLETQEGAGGYAKSQSADFATRQHAALAPFVAESDVVITTAAIPGRAAPLLVTEEMVMAMRPGSVVVDLAAQSGGNCALSKPGETGVFNGVSVWGGADVPSQLPVHASKLYGANISAFVALIKAGDMQDEILAGSRVTEGGRFVHEAVRNALAPNEPEPAPASTPEPTPEPQPALSSEQPDQPDPIEVPGPSDQSAQPE